jgi:HK97 gp10 family phage protein
VAEFSLIALAAELAAQAARTRGLAAQVVAKTAADIERDAKIAAPVDTGNLRSSISSTVSGLTAEIGPTANYGAFVEYGTARSGPQPYLRPAYDRHLPTFERAIERIGGMDD